MVIVFVYLPGNADHDSSLTMALADEIKVDVFKIHPFSGVTQMDYDRQFEVSL
jgi:hypothetical protein